MRVTGKNQFMCMSSEMIILRNSGLIQSGYRAVGASVGRKLLVYLRIIAERQLEIVEAWDEYFGS